MGKVEFQGSCWTNIAIDVALSNTRNLSHFSAVLSFWKIIDPMLFPRPPLTASLPVAHSA